MRERKSLPSALDIAILALALLFAVTSLTVLGPCGPKPDGSWMVCHWAGNVASGLAIVMSTMALAHLLLGNPWAKIGIDVGLIPVSVLCMLVPGVLIGLCRTSTMRCHTAMRPADILFSGLIIAIALIDILVQKKRLKSE